MNKARKDAGVERILAEDVSLGRTLVRQEKKDLLILVIRLITLGIIDLRPPKRSPHRDVRASSVILAYKELRHSKNELSKAKNRLRECSRKGQGDIEKE